MSEIILGINWLAVVIGAVVSFVLGWLWYSPKLFGKAWASGVGVDGSAKPPAMAMITQALGTFLLAWLVGLTAASNALLTIVLIVVTFMFLSAGQGLFSRKSGRAIIIEQGYIFAMLVIMVIAQGVF